MTLHNPSFHSPAKREPDREPVCPALNRRLNSEVTLNWNLEGSVRTWSFGHELCRTLLSLTNHSGDQSQPLKRKNFPQRASLRKTR